ncbi:MAG: serine--tRNA ligase [Acholeplasmataceae bacterium]|jgi:seryl-tRNA synthetase
MLDLKLICDNNEEVIQRLETRGGDFSYLKEVPKLVDKRRDLIIKGDDLKSKRNQTSKLIGEYKREGKDVSGILASISNYGDEIKKIDEEINTVETKIRDILLITPNLPALEVPVGTDETANKEIKKWGTPRKFNFPIKDHVELGTNLGILDFQRAAKVTGPRFVYEVGLGARLERALIQFMMDVHSIEGHYTECMPPYIINSDSMYGTGQFPKFKEESFKLEKFDWYLNPTAEVPMINMYRDEIIDGDVLPLRYCAYTTAFRSEAGSAGKDTRGMLRQHQFNKVELIKFATPEESYKELDLMLASSESILQKLELPYRVVTLSTGDMGFSMSKTYDIEVWLPGQDKYREIASISNAEDYQARRANIRFKRSKDAKTEYVHTLNGSGVAVGRTLIAILENYQNEDGTITVPKALVPYLKTNVIK